MKKTLLAASLLAAFGAAFAQTANLPQVTLSGVADIALGMEKLDGVSNTVLRSGSHNGSRITVKAKQALGNGMDVFAHVETGINIDTAATRGTQFGLGDRQAFVGLKGGFGTVSAGRQYSAYFDFYGDLDPMDTDSFSPMDTRVWLGHNSRVNNAVKYQSNNYSGFSFAAMYGLGEDKTATNSSASHDTSLNARYDAGKLSIGVGLQSEKNTTNLYKRDNTLVGGSYDLGVAKLTAMVNTGKATVGALSGNFKETTLGANIPFGQASLDLAMSSSKDGAQKDSGFGARFNYDLNKQLRTYVGLNSSKVGDVKYSLIAAGLRYKF